MCTLEISFSWFEANVLPFYFSSILRQQSADIIPVNYQVQVSDSKSDSLTSVDKENTADSTFEDNSVVGNCENMSPSSLINAGSSDSQEKNNLPISNNEVITEQSKTALSSSTVTIKRKLSEMDNEQLNNNHKKQCLSQSVIVERLSQSVIVGNCQISYPPPIIVQSVC